jgi:hypothetical protein
VSEYTIVRTEATLAGGQLVDPKSPGPIGPSESEVDVVVLVVSGPVAVAGFGTGVGVGVGVAVGTNTPVLIGGGEVEPPLHPAMRAARATTMSGRRSIAISGKRESCTFCPSAELP